MKHLQKLGYIALGAVLSLTVAFLAVPSLAASVTELISVTYSDMKIIIDGKQFTTLDSYGNVVKPFVYNDTTYLPLRSVAEAVGKPVNWEASSNTAYIGQRPGETKYLMDVVKPYSTDNYIEYSSGEYILMGGTKYYNGF
jgi:hypothetical protein